MKTIEETAEILAKYHHLYYSDRLKDDIVHVLTEQDKIARAEERERCIRFREWLTNGGK